MKLLLPALAILLLTACAQSNLNWPGYMCSGPKYGVLAKQFESPEGIVLPAGTKILVSGCEHGDSALMSFRVDRWDSENIESWEPEHPNTYNFYTLGTTAEECEISGKAVLWAYDACFWEYETDDSIHPGVIDCVEEGQELIERIGSCEAKRIFKSRICDMAREWKTEDIDSETCISSDVPLGPSVRDGGI